MNEYITGWRFVPPTLSPQNSYVKVIRSVKGFEDGAFGRYLVIVKWGYEGGAFLMGLGP